MEIGRDPQVFLDILPESMLCVTATGIIVAANRAALNLFQRTEKQLVGIDLTGLIAEPAEQFLSYLKRCCRGRQFGLALFTFRRHNGSEGPYRCEGALFRHSVNLAERILLIRQVPQAEVTSRFVALNDQISALNRARHRLELDVKARTSDLMAAQTTLQELSARLLKAQDEERRRLARDLHDSSGQLLTAIQMNLSVMDGDQGLPDGLRDRLSRTIALTNQVIGEVRTVSHLLHPPLLDEAGLPLALQSYVDGFEERSNIAVSVDIPATFTRVSTEAETAIFRIVQECLTNIHRHSGSKTATILLTQGADIVTLEVGDEGHGIPGDVFDNQNASKCRMGVGLRGMQERVRLLGGVIEFVDAKPGTLVRVEFPFARIAPSRVTATLRSVGASD